MAAALILLLLEGDFFPFNALAAPAAGSGAPRPRFAGGSRLCFSFSALLKVQRDLASLTGFFSGVLALFGMSPWSCSRPREWDLGWVLDLGAELSGVWG